MTAVPACIKSGVAHPFIQESHRGFPSVFVGTIVPSFADTSLRLHCRSSIRIRCISSRKGTHPNQGLLRWRTSSICPSTGKYRYLRSSFSTLFANCVLVAQICVFVASWEVSDLGASLSNFAPSGKPKFSRHEASFPERLDFHPSRTDLFAPEQIARYVLCSMTSFLQHKTLALAEGWKNSEVVFSWKRECDVSNAGDAVKH